MSQDNAQKSSEPVRKSLIVADAMYMIACDRYASTGERLEAAKVFAMILQYTVSAPVV